MPELKVRVLKRNIAKGIKRDPGLCPIACRLRELGFADAAVYGDNVVLMAGGLTQAEIPPPKIAERFIKDFDKGKPVKPFSFSLHGIRADMLKAAKKILRSRAKKKQRSK